MATLCGVCHINTNAFNYLKGVHICDVCAVNTYIRCNKCGRKANYPTQTTEFFNKSKIQCKQCKPLNERKKLTPNFCILCKNKGDESLFHKNSRICDECCSDTYKRKCKKCRNVKFYSMFNKQSNICTPCDIENTIIYFEDKISGEIIQIDEITKQLKYQKNKNYPNKVKIEDYKYKIDKLNEAIDEYYNKIDDCKKRLN